VGYRVVVGLVVASRCSAHEGGRGQPIGEYDVGGTDGSVRDFCDTLDADSGGNEAHLVFGCGCFEVCRHCWGAGERRAGGSENGGGDRRGFRLGRCSADNRQASLGNVICAG